MKKQFYLIAGVLLAIFIAASCGSTSLPPSDPGAAPPAAEYTPPPTTPPAPVEAEPDLSPPVISVSFSPEYFSPDGDGVDDLLTVRINVESASPIESWRIEIREPNAPHNLFSSWEGTGMPPAEFVWDGYSTNGELVQSAMEYLFSIRVTNIHNNYSVYEGSIWIDVLVIREGDVLSVIVPAIVFAANMGDFTGLDLINRGNNDLVLRRIAIVLNRFNTYNVLVEGHANPTTPPGTAARTNEEVGTARVIGLQPLSEERARSVLEYLVFLGVDRERLSYIGMGGTRPVAAFEDRINWWRNRRVEFILVR